MIDYSAWVAQAEARLKEIDQERNRLLAIVENARALAAGAPVADTANLVRVRVRSRPPAAGSIMDATRTAVAKILDAIGEPVETRDLVPLVKEEDVPIGGKDDIATLSARLSNSGEQFRLHKGIGWWFADRPLPGAFSVFEEAEGQTVEAQPSASGNDSNGGKSDAAALDNDDLL